MSFDESDQEQKGCFFSSFTRAGYGLWSGWQAVMPSWQAICRKLQASHVHQGMNGPPGSELPLRGRKHQSGSITLRQCMLRRLGYQSPETTSSSVTEIAIAKLGDLSQRNECSVLSERGDVLPLQDGEKKRVTAV